MRNLWLGVLGLLALALLDPGVTAWAERSALTHDAQHVALAVCGAAFALVAHSRSRPEKLQPKSTGADSSST